MWPYLDKAICGVIKSMAEPVFAEYIGKLKLKPTVSLALFFNHNTLMGPAYRVLVDNNFINFCIPNKLDLEKGMMDCLYAKCEFRITGFFNLM
ncbi:rRNA-processing protein FCF1-like [Quercus lobata]|uniref:rRNA-processing protein FCF1-like n=1 Tax=Quercus lobata TaxID=97700 RepID=UPI0012480726|nr:rRNA-processing protein FCF1-like [Quercus lobata]